MAWAVRVFTEWQNQRGKGDCPPNLLEVGSANQLNHWLSRYVVDARQTDGRPYPSSKLYQSLAGLLRHVRSKRRDCLNFLEKNDSRFKELRVQL